MLQFRRITTSDIPVIQRLASEIWDVCYNDILTPEQIKYMLDWMYSKQTISEDLANGVSWEMLELEEGTPIGFLSVTLEKEKAKLNKIYLKDIFQGKGYGHQALKYATELARRQGCTSLSLTVNKQNYKAIKAYERAVLVRTDSINVNIGEGFVMDDYVYTAQLQ